MKGPAKNVSSNPISEKIVARWIWKRESFGSLSFLCLSRIIEDISKRIEPPIASIG
jgi:hypothetical protein